MSEEAFVKEFVEKVEDSTKLRHLREDVSRMCKSDRVSTFPGFSCWNGLFSRITARVDGQREHEVPLSCGLLRLRKDGWSSTSATDLESIAFIVVCSV